MTFEPHEGLLVGERYRLVEKLAHGGMGSVWKAHHEQLDAPVAVKFMTTALDAQLLARFEREAKACARLKSPHVVRVHDFGTVDRSPYMVMELLEGEDLAALLKRETRLPFERLAPIAMQIAKGLMAAHDAGIVHRDLKPANVYLARAGREQLVKLLDFGIAREVEGGLVEDQTTTGMVLGSPHHMSPEQAAGMDVDLRTDLWSFGILLYQALTGVRPFRGESLSAVVFAIATHPVTPPSQLQPHLPMGIDAFFERALARNRIHRFSAADDMARALFEVFGRTGSSIDESSPSLAAARASAAAVAAAATAAVHFDPPAPSWAPLASGAPHAPQLHSSFAGQGAELPSSPTLAASAQALGHDLANPFAGPKRKRRNLMFLAAGSAVVLFLGLALVTGRSDPKAGDHPAAAGSGGVPFQPVAASAPEPQLPPSAGASGSAQASASASAPPAVSAQPTINPKPAATNKPAVTKPPQGKNCPSGKIRDSFSGLCVSPP